MKHEWSSNTAQGICLRCGAEREQYHEKCVGRTNYEPEYVIVSDGRNYNTSLYNARTGETLKNVSSVAWRADDNGLCSAVVTLHKVALSSEPPPPPNIIAEPYVTISDIAFTSDAQRAEFLDSLKKFLFRKTGGFSYSHAGFAEDV